MLGKMWRKENILKYSLFLKSEIPQIGLLLRYWFPNQPNNQKTWEFWGFSCIFPFVFLRYAYHATKSHILSIKLVTFQTGIQPWNHNQDTKLFTTFKSLPVPLCFPSNTPWTPFPDTINLCSVTIIQFTFSRVLYKLNNIVCSLLFFGLAFFAQHNYFETHPNCIIYQ